MFNFIKKILYALPFGLKAADEQLAGSATDVSDASHIQQQVEEKSVLNDLLRGEVTEEVEELRYRTYEVAEKSREYDYIGNGVAIKKETEKDNKVTRFSQESKLVISGVLDELKHVGDYGVELYTTSITYNRFNRFKVEAFLTMIDVLIKENTIRTKLHFLSTPNPYNANSAPFINELKRIGPAIDSEYALERNEIANSMNSMTFVTTNATNNTPDLLQYTFHSPHIKGYDEGNGEIILTYEWDTYNMENLREKYFSESMARKYEEHAKKDISLDANQYVKDEVCYVCGKVIPSFMKGVVDRDNGKPICVKCLTKKVKGEIDD